MPDIDIRLICDKVAIIKDKQHHSGGVLYLADDEDSNIGKVVAVSPELTEDYPELVVGVTVRITDYSGSTICIQGHDVTFVKVSDVLAVL